MLPRFGYTQGAGLDRQINAGRDNKNMIRHQHHAVCCLLHGHNRMAGEQIHHPALMRGIEMLDHNEGKTGVSRQGIQKPAERL